MVKVLDRVLVWTRPDGTTRTTYLIAAARMLKIRFPDGSVLEMTMEQFDRWRSPGARHTVISEETDEEFLDREARRLKALPDLAGHSMVVTKLEEAFKI